MLAIIDTYLQFYDSGSAASETNMRAIADACRMVIAKAKGEIDE